MEPNERNAESPRGTVLDGDATLGRCLQLRAWGQPSSCRSRESGFQSLFMNPLSGSSLFRSKPTLSQTKPTLSQTKATVSQTKATLFQTKATLFQTTSILLSVELEVN